MTTTNQRAVEEMDYTPGKLDETAPPRIWLQVDTSANNDERDEPFPADIDGVTWQDEQIGGLEVEYVRADLATRAPGWRPISEAPEVGQLVAVHAPGAMLTDVWPARWNGHNFDAGGGWFEQGEVTGWCPLPTLPPAPGEG